MALAPKKFIFCAFLFTCQCQMVEQTLQWVLPEEKPPPPPPPQEPIKKSLPLPDLKIVSRSLVVKRLKEVIQKKKGDTLDSLMGEGASRRIRELDGKEFIESEKNKLITHEGESYVCQSLKDYRSLEMGLEVLVPLKRANHNIYTKGFVAGISRTTRELLIIYKSAVKSQSFGIQSYDFSSLTALRLLGNKIKLIQ